MHPSQFLFHRDMQGHTGRMMMEWSGARVGEALHHLLTAELRVWEPMLREARRGRAKPPRRHTIHDDVVRLVAMLKLAHHVHPEEPRAVRVEPSSRTPVLVQEVHVARDVPRGQRGELRVYEVRVRFSGAVARA